MLALCFNRTMNSFDQLEYDVLQHWKREQLASPVQLHELYSVFTAAAADLVRAAPTVCVFQART